jgi:hypothetical protein
MMEFILILALIGAVVYLYLGHRDIVTAAYYSGYRACAKEAVTCLKDLERKATEKAPIGELCGGVVRAEAIHECGMLVRDLTYRIGRPL